MKNNEIVVELLKEVDEESLKVLRELIFQLNPEAKLPTAEYANKVVSNPSTHLFVARDENNKIVGTGALVICTTLFITRGRIEDMVIDKSQQGKKIGEKMLEAFFKKAKEEKVQVIQLTSNPARSEAHKFYEKYGFELYDTNVYRYFLNE